MDSFVSRVAIVAPWPVGVASWLVAVASWLLVFA